MRRIVFELVVRSVWHQPFGVGITNEMEKKNNIPAAARHLAMDVRGSRDRRRCCWRSRRRWPAVLEVPQSREASRLCGRRWRRFGHRKGQPDLQAREQAKPVVEDRATRGVAWQEGKGLSG